MNSWVALRCYEVVEIIHIVIFSTSKDAVVTLVLGF